MKLSVWTIWLVTGTLAYCLAATAGSRERTERFDRKPTWISHQSRSATPRPRTVRQDFGYSATSHAGGEVGELGGFITPAAEPSYYAKRIPVSSFADPLTASGRISLTGRPLHVLIGFFNAGTLNEWRTPNTIALRISGRGDVFYAWLEYATSRWRAGGDEPQGFPTKMDPVSGRRELIGFAAKGVVHRWTLRYDPDGNGGAGVVTATIGDARAICNLAPGHQADGATFNRFGLLTVMKSADTGGEIWLDDVTVNGAKEGFDQDPRWEGFQNRRTFVSANVRPRFDFGYSATRYAGGRSRGEMGGLVFRGDCRYPDKMAYYADRLGELTLAKPLQASGTVALRRGVSDSTVLIGFFHSRDSMRVNPSQKTGIPASFLGISTDGPSRVGFYFAPTYRLGDDARSVSSAEDPPRIHPDGTAHTWALKYDPAANGGKGRLTVRLDGKTVSLELAAGEKDQGARFDRFGIITTWIDGNAQTLYFDDLTYTCRQ